MKIPTLDLIHLTTYRSVPGVYVLDLLHITSFNPPSYSPRNYIMKFYFNRFPRLWNSLPTIDLASSTNVNLKKSYGNTSLQISILKIHALALILPMYQMV